MSDAQEIHIACPQCKYSNAAAIPVGKYKEAVYQPCNYNEGQQDHNMKGHIRCENCENSLNFHWCAGHTTIENDTDLRNLKTNLD